MKEGSPGETIPANCPFLQGMLEMVGEAAVQTYLSGLGEAAIASMRAQYETPDVEPVAEPNNDLNGTDTEKQRCAADADRPEKHRQPDTPPMAKEFSTKSVMDRAPFVTLEATNIERTITFGEPASVETMLTAMNSVEPLLDSQIILRQQQETQSKLRPEAISESFANQSAPEELEKTGALKSVKTERGFQQYVATSEPPKLPVIKINAKQARYEAIEHVAVAEPIEPQPEVIVLETLPPQLKDASVERPLYRVTDEAEVVLGQTAGEPLGLAPQETLPQDSSLVETAEDLEDPSQPYVAFTLALRNLLIKPTAEQDYDDTPATDKEGISADLVSPEAMCILTDLLEGLPTTEEGDVRCAELTQSITELLQGLAPYEPGLEEITERQVEQQTLLADYCQELFELAGVEVKTESIELFMRILLDKNFTRQITSEEKPETEIVDEGLHEQHLGLVISTIASHLHLPHASRMLGRTAMLSAA